MKYTFLFALLICLSACHKDPPPPEPHYAATIEGRWVDMTGTFSPNWHWQFEAGLLTQYYFQANTVITTLTYPYALRDSTIIIGGDATNFPREWDVLFECEDVVQVTQSNTQLSQRFWLKRETP
jgi:hypothetical protein